jgi:hypothetical protein
MQSLWAASAASLLDLLTEARGGTSEAALSRLSQGRIGTVGPTWPLGSHSTVWTGNGSPPRCDVGGPLMEERLHRLSQIGDIA